MQLIGLIYDTDGIPTSIVVMNAIVALHIPAESKTYNEIYARGEDIKGNGMNLYMITTNGGNTYYFLCHFISFFDQGLDLFESELEKARVNSPMKMLFYD